jgi:hypothetical protein
MTATQWIGVAIIAVLLIFAGFAFRQGMKVKPEKAASRQKAIHTSNAALLTEV